MTSIRSCAPSHATSGKRYNESKAPSAGGALFYVFSFIAYGVKYPNAAGMLYVSASSARRTQRRLDGSSDVVSADMSGGSFFSATVTAHPVSSHSIWLKM